MILTDTSVLIAILKDKKGDIVKEFNKIVEKDVYVITRFSQLELLQGAKNEREWNLLNENLSSQYYLEISDNSWLEAARIFYELRRKGITINSPIDCCIAQLALEYNAILLHHDTDFEKVKKVRKLKTIIFG
jgi:predicted nucleic acid-binding protein